MKKIIIVLGIILGIAAISFGSIFVYNKLSNKEQPIDNYESLSEEEKQKFAQAVVKDYINSFDTSPTPTEQPTNATTYKTKCSFCGQLVDVTENNSWFVEEKDYVFHEGTECEEKFNDVLNHFYDCCLYDDVANLVKEWLKTDKIDKVKDNTYTIKMYRNDTDVFRNDQEISTFEHDPLYMALEVEFGERIQNLDFKLMDADYEICVNVPKKYFKKSVKPTRSEWE